MTRHHVLIVDDQYEMRSMLRSSLDTLHLDLEIVDVPSAEEALLVLGKEQIDLMVVDVRLPGMSGLELRERAGQRMPTIQLILITGVSDEKVRHQVSQAGVAAYFYKPIQIGPFLEAVCICLGTSGADMPPPSTKVQEVISDAAQPVMVNPLDGLCAHQAVLGALILTGQGNILFECGSISPQDERQEIERTILSLMEQDRGRSGSIAGAAFPCHHLFSGQARDLWVTCLGVELALATALPPGEAAHMASGMLREIERLRARLALVHLEEDHIQAAETPPQDIQLMDEAEDGNLSALLEQETDLQLHVDEVDAYWDVLAREDHSPEQSRQGILSYAQALRLGLAPGEDNA